MSLKVRELPPEDGIASSYWKVLMGGFEYNLGGAWRVFHVTRVDFALYARSPAVCVRTVTQLIYGRDQGVDFTCVANRNGGKAEIEEKKKAAASRDMNGWWDPTLLL